MNDIEKQRSKNEVKSELLESDWELRTFSSKEDMEVMIYLYDHFDTGELIMAGLRKKDIQSLSAFSHSMDDITSSIDAGFKSYIEGTNEQERATWSEIVGSMLGLYMLNTKTYLKLKNMEIGADETIQFIVLRHKNKQHQAASFTPFSLVSKSQILTPEEIQSFALDVIARDEQKNAGLFKFNAVSKLRKE